MAYSIVKECIRPDSRYGFYCDAYLDFEYHDDCRALRRARLIIRLLHLLRPSHVWMPDADKRLVKAIKAAMPKMRVATQRECPKDTDFIVIFHTADLNRQWYKMDTQAECGLLAFGTPESCPENVTLELTARDFQIILRKIGMEKNQYEVL